MPRSNAATFGVIACSHTQTCNFTFPGNLVCIFKIIISQSRSFPQGDFRGFPWHVQRNLCNVILELSACSGPCQILRQHLPPLLALPQVQSPRHVKFSLPQSLEGPLTVSILSDPTYKVEG